MEKSNEDLKQWLHRYGELQRDADRIWDRLDELRGRIQSARTASLEELPHGNRVNADRIGADIARLEDMEREAQAAQEEATTTRREIEAMIRKISGRGWADRREVLRLRYIDGLRWEDVSEKLYGDSQDFWDRTDIYLRRAFKLHKTALEELAKYVLLQAGQEIDIEMEDRKNDHF